jgi:hypothetical protein
VTESRSGRATAFSDTPVTFVGRYGRKGILDPQIAAKIEALEPPVIKQMRDILLATKNRADAGELTTLKTY